MMKTIKLVIISQPLRKNQAIEFAKSYGENFKAFYIDSGLKQSNGGGNLYELYNVCRLYNEGEDVSEESVVTVSKYDIFAWPIKQDNPELLKKLSDKCLQKLVIFTEKSVPVTRAVGGFKMGEKGFFTRKEVSFTREERRTIAKTVEHIARYLLGLEK